MNYSILLVVLCCITMSAQNSNNELPYAAIPHAPENYTAGTIVSRMIDGLGFRYYWATEGLSKNDMHYEPANDGRTIAETMVHLYNLSNTIINSARKLPNDRTVQRETPVLNDLRKLTLENLHAASLIFREVSDLSEFTIVFKNTSGSTEFPFWNQINGPIEDAVWHSGQIVVLRRSAGNPINPKANVFLGKLND